MACYRPFCLLILVLYCVALVCANGVDNEKDVTDVVHEVQTAAKKTLNNLEGKLRNAESNLNDIELFKQSAVQAATATEAAAVNGNQEAKGIAQKAKSALEELLELLPNATLEAQNIIDNMKSLLVRAKELNTKATKEKIWIKTDEQNDSSNTKANAKDIKAKLEALDKDINTASSPLELWSVKKYKMSDLVKDAQLSQYQVEGIVAFSKFETFFQSAESDIKLVEQKRDAIDTIVQQMKNICDSTPSDLRQHISNLHSTVEGHLKSASHVVHEANEEHEGMLLLREQADSTLVNVKTAPNVRDAMKAVRTVNWVVKNAKTKLEKIKKALQSATIYEENALLRKKKAMNAINDKNNKPDVKHDNDQTNSQDSTEPHNSVQKAKGSPSKSGTTNHTIANMEKTVSKEKDPTQSTRDGPTENKIMKHAINTQDHTESEQSVKETIESPTGIETKQPTIINLNKPVSEGNEPTEDIKEGPTGSETIKPTTNNSDESVNTQDMENTTKSPVVSGTMQPTITNPNKPVSGGTDPTQSASSDNAMTVSVPLLLALIACAALN